jgi:hypothetical protein
MDAITRRRFLTGLAALGGTCLQPRAFASRKPSEIAVTADFDRPLFPVPDDFLGLSFETRRIVLQDYLIPENETVIELIRKLSPKGVIRIGGNTSDEPVSPEQLGRPQLERFAKFIKATGWNVIYGLNLGSGTAERAADEAALVSELLGPENLVFQIGNEPDLFQMRKLQPSGYGKDTFITDWRNFSHAVKARVPGTAFAGPDVSSDTSWMGPFVKIFGNDVRFVTHHYYSEGPAGNKNVSISRMLESSQYLTYRLRAIDDAIRSDLPLRMTEMNSVWNGGQPGISDTFASALWAIDAMLTLAAAGWIGVNFHTNGAVYSPIRHEADGSFQPQPLYEGLVFFSKMARGSVCPVLIQEDPPNDFRVFAIRGSHDERRLICLNLSGGAVRRIEVALPWREATFRVLSAPGLESKTDIRFSDAAEKPLVSREKGAFKLELAPATATVVEFVR